MQRHSKLYTGVKGTNYDMHEQFIPDGYFREKRNTRISSGDGMLSNNYVEGFSNLGSFPGISQVWLINLEGSISLGTVLNITFNIEVPTRTGVLLVTFNGDFETIDNLHVQLSDKINELHNSSGVYAASKGLGIHIWYDDPAGQNSVFDIVIDNWSINGGAVRNASTKISEKCDVVAPIGYWSHNNEAAILTVVPEKSAVIDPDEDDSYEHLPTLCQVWLRTYFDNGLIESTKLLYNNNLNYRLFKKPILKGIIENACIARIYVTEGYNFMRSFNLRDKNLFAVEPETSNINPQTILPPPEILGVEDGGILPTGAIQYAFRIYGSNGSVSIISSVSNMVYLPVSSMGVPSRDIYGGEPEELSSKVVRLKVKEINQEYDRIQVIAIYRQTELAITDVEVIYDGNIDQGELSVVHSRKGQGEPLTVDELFLDNKAWDKAKVIEIHENSLIAANLTGRLQDMGEFDSLIKQYDNLGNTYPGKFNPNPDVYKYCKDQAKDPNENNPKLILGGQSENYENGNGIKIWFEVDEFIVDEEFQHIPKPHYGLWNAYPVLFGSDDIVGTDKRRSGSLIRNIRPGVQSDPRINNLNYANHLEGHNNPTMGSEFSGYQQNETYRFGMVFGKNGKDLDVRFMGDIKFPDYTDDYIPLDGAWHHFLYAQNPDGSLKQTYSIGRHEIYFSNGKNRVRQYARSVKLMVDVRLPNGIRENFDTFKIVRAERNIRDRSIMGQGLLNQVRQFWNHWISDREKQGNKYGQGDLELLIGVRPNANYRKMSNYMNDKTWFVHGADTVFGVEQLINSGDMELHVIAEMEAVRTGYLPTVEHPNMQDTDNDTNKTVRPRIAIYGVKRQKDFTVFDAQSRDIAHLNHCETSQLIPGSAYGATISFRNRTRGMIVANNGHSITGQYQMNSAPGTLVTLDSGLPFKTSDQSYFDKFVKCLVEVRRTVPNQYGGKTSYALENTQWVETGVVLPIEGNHYMHVVGGGDIFTNLVQFNQFDDGARERRDHHPYGGSNGNTEQFTEYGLAVAFTSNNIGNFAFSHGEHWGGEGYGWVRKAEHFYNPAYHAKNDAKRYVYLRDKPCEDVHYPGLIAVARTKVNGKRVDNWLQFPTFDFFEADLSLGGITNIISIKGILWVVQENGLGILSFNPYAVANTQDGAEVRILNGTGQKIKKITYVSKRHGSRHTHSRINGHDGVYLVDDTNYELLMLNDQGYKRIALPQAYTAWFRKMLKNKGLEDKPLLRKGIHGYFDSEHNEVVIQIDKE